MNKERQWLCQVKQKLCIVLNPIQWLSHVSQEFHGEHALVYFENEKTSARHKISALSLDPEIVFLSNQWKNNKNRIKQTPSFLSHAESGEFI